MRKGLVAIIIGIAVAIAGGTAFAIDMSMRNSQPGVAPSGTTVGHNVVVNIEEKLGISESP